jgi:ubiquinone/menaquinone biosynthesis C-methylase UbiE
MQQAFDTVAQRYDDSFTYGVIGMAQRNIVWDYLESALSPNDELKILELNCGTGEDALWFAKKGHNVLATDISEKMLEITKDKINKADLLSTVHTMRINITNIDSAGIKEKFDLIFSNFGGMNCIAFKEMEKLPSGVKKLLKPNGQLIMVVMPTFCLWETIYFLLKLKFRKAFRRLSKEGTIAKFNGTKIKTFYFSPARIKKLFKQHFEVLSIKPVGFFIPPSYLDNFFSSRIKMINNLKKLEQAVSRFSFFAGSSDHFLIHLQTKA